MEKKQNWATGQARAVSYPRERHQPEICYIKNKHLSGWATVLAIENRIQSDILLKAGFVVSKPVKTP